MRNHFCTISFLLIGLYSFGQTFEPDKQHIVDSLKTTALDESEHDTLRVISYLELATQYYLSFPDSAMYWIKIAEELSERSDYLLGRSECYGWLGYLHDTRDETDKALEYNFKSVEVLKEIGNYRGLATALNNIGVIYNNLGDVDKTLYYFHQSLYIYEQIGNIYGISLGYNNIAHTYLDQDDYLKAEEYYLKGLEKCEEAENSKDQDYYRGMAMTYNGLASLYRQNEKFELGLMYCDLSQKMCEESGDLYNMLYSINTKGLIQFELYKKSNLPADDPYRDSLLNEASKNFYKTIELAISLNSTRSIATSKKNLAALKFEIGETKEATKLAEESFEIAMELGYPDVISWASEQLSKIYAKENQGMKAYEMHVLHIQMRDSVLNLETQKLAIETKTQHEFEKKKALDDAEHNKEMAIKEEEKKRQSLISYAAIFGAILLALFLYIVFNRLKITRQQKKTIEEQKLKVEEAHVELEEKNQEILDSISYAKRIQTAILPPDKMFHSTLPNAFVLYIPKDIVAGDFYWMEKVNDTILFAAADCTGHGVPGAMVSVVCNGALNRSVREFGLTEPGKILDKTREIVIQEFEKSEEEVKDGMDIALCKLEGMKLSFAGAHNPLWVIRNGELIEYKSDKQPVGKFDRATSFTTTEVELQEGDTFYVFSDGFPDQFGGEKGKKYKAKNFKQFLLSIQDKDISEHGQLLEKEFNSWKGGFEQLDDICIIGVKV